MYGDDGQDRLGKSGRFAEVGDIVEVVKGRKFPIGMKMVVAGFDAWCKYSYGFDGPHWGRAFQAFGDKQILFYGEGFKKYNINADNVEIVAIHEDKDWNPEYRNVHEVEVYA